MAIKVTTKELFRHSYSREFGWEISEGKPEHKVVCYRVYVDGNYTASTIDRHYPSNEFHAFCWINNTSFFGTFGTIQEAKKFIQKTYESN